jgi:hypothetical protein
MPLAWPVPETVAPAEVCMGEAAGCMRKRQDANRFTGA